MTPTTKRGLIYSRGFTLAELAIVLVIVGLLLGGLFMPLSAQMDSRNTNDTQKTLNDIRDALIGFAATNGRLPCPASATSSGVESPPGGGNCDSVTTNNSYAGYVPAATLGITPIDSNGFAIDAWGNRIHYAVTTANSGSYDFTTASGMKTRTMTSLAPDIKICSDSSCSTILSSNAVAIIYSTGKNTVTGGIGADENENPNPNSTLTPDKTFVSHTPTASGATNGEFDDIVIWISPNILYNRMIVAGQLP